MSGVVRYLKKLGVQNVGRFVSRLPPVLGYDVHTNLAPKVSEAKYLDIAVGGAECAVECAVGGIE